MDKTAFSVSSIDDESAESNIGFQSDLNRIKPNLIKKCLLIFNLYWVKGIS